MDLIMIPQALMIFYGGLVLGCGSVLGFILGRNLRKQLPVTTPPDLLEQRLRHLEREIEDTREEMARLREESAFLRELRAPPDQDEAHAITRRFVA